MTPIDRLQQCYQHSSDPRTLMLLQFISEARDGMSIPQLRELVLEMVDPYPLSLDGKTLDLVHWLSEGEREDYPRFDNYNGLRSAFLQTSSDEHLAAIRQVAPELISPKIDLEWGALQFRVDKSR